MKVAPQNLVVIALGSNVGDSLKHLLEAAKKIASIADGPLLHSSIYETQPVDCPPGSKPFLNSVVAFVPRTHETPETLLQHLKRLESQAGRKPKKTLNEPRPLDLDIIVFQTELRKSEALTLPHPRAHLRAFVLAPLCEIAPRIVFPGQTLSVLELFDRLPSDAKQGIRKLSSPES